MPWVNYCPVCKSLVPPGQHAHPEAFTFHYRGEGKPADETLLLIGRVAQSGRAAKCPWLDPGWSTEED